MTREVMDNAIRRLIDAVHVERARWIERASAELLEDAAPEEIEIFYFVQTGAIEMRSPYGVRRWASNVKLELEPCNKNGSYILNVETLSPPATGSPLKGLPQRSSDGFTSGSENWV